MQLIGPKIFKENFTQMLKHLLFFVVNLLLPCFKEKGFCMRGDLCPYDHGTDPVILEDVNVPIYNGGPTPQAPIMSQPPPPNLTGSLRHPAASHPPIRPPPPPPPPVPLGNHFSFIRYLLFYFYKIALITFNYLSFS